MEAGRGQPEVGGRPLKAPAAEVYVGRKPTSAYLMAGMRAYGANGRVVIKARGRTISKAVDVAEILRTRILKCVEVEGVSIGCDKYEVEGRRRNVSTIEIVLVRKR